jgi:alpha-tubulin suppressor-like RCC1 family protein
LHTFAIREDGTLWGWGYNSDGQLGTGDKTNRYAPVQIGSDSNWAVVDAAGSAGGDGLSRHSLGLKQDGTLWAWGGNSYGQLGDGTTSESLVPKQIGTDTDWVAIAASVYTSFGIKEDGSLYSWGADTDGTISYQGLLGDGGDLQGADVDTPTQVGSESDWASISAQETHALAIKEDGTLWGWGQNGDYELGQGSGSTSDQSAPIQIGSDSDWVTVDATLYRSMATKSDGTRWVWGYFDDGFFALGYDNDPDGDGTYDDVYAPTQAGSETDWVTVALGSDHGVGVRGQDRIFSWGWNSYGEVGDNTTTTREEPLELTLQ